MNRKFNIIDVLIIILVLAVICVGIYVYFAKFSNSSTEPANTVKIEYTIEVNEITETAANSFKPGDAVTLGETASGSGVIKSVTVESYKTLTENKEEGLIVLSEVPKKFTAYVTIASDVVKTADSYTTGSETISVGREMPFNAVGAAAEECYIVNLTEAK